MATVDPGKDRPAIALVPNRPGKAFGGSCHAPPGTMFLFAEIIKRALAGAKHARDGQPTGGAEPWLKVNGTLAV